MLLKITGRTTTTITTADFLSHYEILTLPKNCTRLRLQQSFKKKFIYLFINK